MVHCANRVPVSDSSRILNTTKSFAAADTMRPLIEIRRQRPVASKGAVFRPAIYLGREGGAIGGDLR
jgi:hypothetical protein